MTEPGCGAVDDGFALLGVLERLDECTRVMLRLRFEQDLTQSEIGEHGSPTVSDAPAAGMPFRIAARC